MGVPGRSRQNQTFICPVPLHLRVWKCSISYVCALSSNRKDPVHPERIIFAYKNFAANRQVTHIGLGVTAMNSAKVLRSAGIRAEVWAVVDAFDLHQQLIDAYSDDPATHVVISAPWIPTADLAALAAEFPETHFGVNCHSNLGFLQADPNAMRLVREGADLERQTWNFRVAANNERLAQWITDAYGVPAAWLPNLYHLDATAQSPRAPFTGGTLRIGAFGATRPLKNFMTAAGAAVQIAATLRCDAELWMSSGREEGGGSVLDAIRQMIQGLQYVKLVETGWQTWPQFRQTVRHMHLLLQPSYTESFNVVTADGVAEGVPSVVSDAIEWAPDNWKAPVDDAHALAKVGLKLLGSRWAPRQGTAALKARRWRRGTGSWEFSR